MTSALLALPFGLAIGLSLGLAGGVAGALAGSRVSAHVPAVRLRQAFALLVSALAAVLLARDATSIL